MATTGRQLDRFRCLVPEAAITTNIRATSSGTVLMFEAEFERRIEAAAGLVGLDPTEFISRAVQQRCAEVLGEGVAVGGTRAGTAATGPDRPGANKDAQVPSKGSGVGYGRSVRHQTACCAQ